MIHRVERAERPWSSECLARAVARRAEQVLEVDTGGGELFSRRVPPAGSIPVEDGEPNIPLAGNSHGAPGAQHAILLKAYRPT